MAMAAIGTVLMVVGVLALVGGLVYVGMARESQDENDDGVFTNPEEGQENKGKAYTGFYIAGGGLLVALLGLGLAIGGRRGAGRAA